MLGKTKNWQLNLEEALREAREYQSALSDMVQRLSEIDGQLSTSKPVGGLPETAKEQQEEFMVSNYHSQIDCLLVYNAGYLTVSEFAYILKKL